MRRDFATDVEHWHPAIDGATFELGDGARTGADAEARLALSSGAALVMEPRTTIRFLLEGQEANPDEPHIEVTAGNAVLEAGEGSQVFHTALGRAVLLPGSRIQLSAEDGRVRMEVRVGSATLTGRDGQTRQLDTGSALVVAVGQAQLVPVSVVPNRVEVPADPLPADPLAADRSPDEPLEGGGEAPASLSLEVHGPGVTIRPADAEDWAPLPAGVHEVEPNAQLRVPSQSRVDAARGDQRVVLRGEGTFRLGEPGRALVEAESGGVSLVAERALVRVRMPGGQIETTTDEATEATLRVGPTETVIRAGEGAIALRTDLGEERELSPGQTVRVSRVGTFSVDDAASPAVTDASEATTKSRPANPLPPLGPPRADLLVRAGQNLIVHVPRSPAVVGFAVPGCPERAVVRARGRRGPAALGENGEVHVALRPGLFRYQAHCVEADNALSEAVARGQVRVLRDSGRRALPRTPPPNRIDADGRRYTVIYENQLPVFFLRWPSAPGAARYALRFDQGGPRRPVSPSRRPRFRLASGTLGDGTHRFSIAAGARRSPATTVLVRFDYAAPRASITSPDDRGFRAGERVRVAGITLPGWSVSVEGSAIPLDRAHRFDTEATAPVDRSAIAICLTHPRRGVHYYLRRSAP